MKERLVTQILADAGHLLMLAAAEIRISGDPVLANDAAVLMLMTGSLLNRVVESKLKAASSQHQGVLPDGK